MKIFEFKISGEKEWIYANTTIQALKEYRHITGNDIDDFNDEDEISELQDDKWDEYTVTYPDEDKEPITFREYVKELKTPAYMCSTVY